jgi:hypothetical protein
MRSVLKVQQEGKFDDIPYSVEMKAKVCIVAQEDYENNLVHA